MRLRIFISAALLLAGLVSANLPVHHSMADLGPCRNCGDTSPTPGSDNGGDLAVTLSFGQ